MSHPTLFPILPSEKAPRKPWLPWCRWCAIVVTLLTVGFFAGRGCQHMKNGYHYSVIDEKSYPFGEGAIRLCHFFEYIGFSIMETDKTLIEFNSSNHGKITLYKAQRCFQE